MRVEIDYNEIGNIEKEILKNYKAKFCDIYLLEIGYNWYGELGYTENNLCKKVKDLPEFIKKLKDAYDLTGYGLKSVRYSHCSINLRYELNNGEYFYHYSINIWISDNKQEIVEINKVLTGGIE